MIKSLADSNLCVRAPVYEPEADAAYLTLGNDIPPGAVHRTDVVDAGFTQHDYNVDNQIIGIEFFDVSQSIPAELLEKLVAGTPVIVPVN